MSRPNPFRRAPVIQFTPEHFPSLTNVATPTSTVVWKRSTESSDTARVYPNGDVYDGKYDENGEPSFGIMKFANGNVYEGPFRSYWIEDTECEFTEQSMDNTESTEQNEYGVMYFPDGRSFWGVFNFGRKNAW